MNYQRPIVRVTRFAAEEILTASSAGEADIINKLGNPDIQSKTVSLDELVKQATGYQGN